MSSALREEGFNGWSWHPVRLICIHWGSGVPCLQGVRQTFADLTVETTHGFRLILQEVHNILSDNLVFKTDELYDLFRNPRADDLQIVPIHLAIKP